VNLPAAESDLRQLADDDVAALGATALSRGSRVRRLREGIPLWPLLLSLSACLVLLEGAALIWVER
jgi:hypothetical protein